MEERTGIPSTNAQQTLQSRRTPHQRRVMCKANLESPPCAARARNTPTLSDLIDATWHKSRNAMHAPLPPQQLPSQITPELVAGAILKLCILRRGPTGAPSPSNSSGTQRATRHRFTNLRGTIVPFAYAPARRIRSRYLGCKEYTQHILCGCMRLWCGGRSPLPNLRNRS